MGGLTAIVVKQCDILMLNSRSLLGLGPVARMETRCLFFVIRHKQPTTHTEQRYGLLVRVQITNHNISNNLLCITQ